MTDVLIDLTDGVLQIRLNRPARKNALSQQMYRDMNAALQRAAEDSSIKVVLLQGGDDCFSAGNEKNDSYGASASQSWGVRPEPARPVLEAGGFFFLIPIFFLICQPGLAWPGQLGNMGQRLPIVGGPA